MKHTPEILAALRKNYCHSELLEETVEANPIHQFRLWFDNALEAELLEPNAFCLSTVDSLNRPDSRIVLLKAIKEEGFVFYTNYNSKKGNDMALKAHVSMNFVWLELERQVRVRGTVEKISAEESDQYFYSRPLESQLGAIVSSQSEKLTSKTLMENAMQEALNKYGVEKPTRPEHWGGYLIKPIEIEFWQGRPNRLHDRLRYVKTEKNWTIERLYP
jgi:pyridoxamine 5'-phosphate oxidase